jgi:DDE superfamily endonuclease
MRTLSKPSTAKCTLEHYTAFLLAEPQSAGCVRLAEVAGGEFAHDAANRFLNRETFSGKDLFEEARPLLDLEGGTLSVDDTVLDKPYSQEGKTELVGYFWSGKHGRAVKGVCLVTLLYTDRKGVRLPVDFRLVDKAEAKTKNELFREMVTEVLAWGLRPALVSTDSWYLRPGKPQVPQEKGTGLSHWLGEEPHRQRTRARVCARGSSGVARVRQGGTSAQVWLCECVSNAR